MTDERASDADAATAAKPQAAQRRLSHGVWLTKTAQPIAVSKMQAGPKLPLGSTRPLALLLHGMTMDRTAMLPLGAELLADFDILCLDLPCHGESLDIPPDGDGSPAALAELILPALAMGMPRLLRDQPVLLVGHSFGGLVAAVLARHFPGVIGLVLGDTPLAMAKQRAATAILRLGLDDGEIRRHAAITRDGFGVVPGGNEERIYYDLPLLQPAPVLLLHAALPFGSKRVDERVPSCIDSMDLAVMAKFGAGKVTCQALEGTSHILFNEAPEAAATAIREWLAQQARR